MSDLEPDRIRSLEREHRASLARAAERAPLYRGLRASAVRRGPRGAVVLGAAAVVGTPSSEAVYVGDMMWTNADLSELPTALASSRDPVPCGSARTVTAVGQWIGVVSSRRVRFER